MRQTVDWAEETTMEGTIMEMIKEMKHWIEVGEQEVYVSTLTKVDAEMGGTADSNTLRYVTSGMSMEDARE